MPKIGRQIFGACRKNTHPVLFLVSICILALATRAAVAILTTSWSFPKGGNSWAFGYEMGQIAASVAMGNGFSWPDWGIYGGETTAWMPPIYPYLIAATFRVFGIYSEQSAVFLLSFQTIMSLLSCVFVYLLGTRLFNPRVGLIAAFVFAVYPPSIHFAVQKIWSTTLFASCLLLVLLCLLKLRMQMNVIRGAGVGVLTGFTALVDPIVVISLPFALLWLYVNSSRDRSATCKVLAATVVLFVLTISPWLIRNYLVFGQYVFIKSNVGNELFLGNNIHASGRFNVPQSKKALSVAEKAFLNSADEATRNKFLWHKAVGFIFAHPSKFLELTTSRLVHYWTFMMQSPHGWRQLSSLLIYFAVLSLAITGLLASGIRAPNLQLMWLFLMTLPLPYYFTVVGLFRYRFPVETILIVSAAYAIHRLISWSRAHSPRASKSWHEAEGQEPEVRTS